jgi:hypothetical protein
VRCLRASCSILQDGGSVKLRPETEARSGDQKRKPEAENPKRKPIEPHLNGKAKCRAGRRGKIVAKFANLLFER